MSWLRHMTDTVMTRARRLWRSRLRHRWLGWRWLVLGAAWAATLALGAAGFGLVDESPAAAGAPLLVRIVRFVVSRDNLYHSFQLFALEYNGPPAGAPRDFEWARWLAPFLASFTLFQAVAALFAERVLLFRMRLFRRHIVICGLGRRGWQLASGFHALGERVVCVEQDGANPRVRQCHDADVPVLVGDATRPDVLRRARIRRARAVFAVTGNDGTNADVALAARRVAERQPGDPPLTCVLHIVDPYFCRLLSRASLPAKHDPSANGFRLSFFNVFDAAAEQLQRHHDPFCRDDGSAIASPHIIVIGAGRMGEAIISHAGRRWWTEHHRTGQRFHVTLVDRHASALADRMALRHPRLAEACALYAEDIELESAAFLAADFARPPSGVPAPTSVFVCVDNDSLGLSAALILAQRLHDSELTILVRTSQESGLATLVHEASADGGVRIVPFGLLEQSCHPSVPIAHERLAIAIHAGYVARRTAEGQSAATNASMAPWEELPESLRESNRRQADDIRAKLDLIGYTLEPLTDWNAVHFQFTDADVETLARAEHKRWVDERVAAGWTPGPEKDVDRKISPYLVPWEGLSEAVRELDREAVRGIPGVVGGAGLQVGKGWQG